MAISSEEQNEAVLVVRPTTFTLSISFMVLVLHNEQVKVVWESNVHT